MDLSLCPSINLLSPFSHAWSSLPCTNSSDSPSNLLNAPTTSRTPIIVSFWPQRPGKAPRSSPKAPAIMCVCQQPARISPDRRDRRQKFGWDVLGKCVCTGENGFLDLSSLVWEWSGGWVWWWGMGVGGWVFVCGVAVGVYVRVNVLLILRVSVFLSRGSEIRS